MIGSIGGANGDGAINGDVLSSSVQRVRAEGSALTRVRLSFDFGEGRDAAFYLTLPEAATMGSQLHQCAGGKDPLIVNSAELGTLVAELVDALDGVKRNSWIGRWRDRARLAVRRLRAKELKLRQTDLFGRADQAGTDGPRDASPAPGRHNLGDGP